MFMHSVSLSLFLQSNTFIRFDRSIRTDQTDSPSTADAKKFYLIFVYQLTTIINKYVFAAFKLNKTHTHAHASCMFYVLLSTKERERESSETKIGTFIMSAITAALANVT